MQIFLVIIPKLTLLLQWVKQSFKKGLRLTNPSLYLAFIWNKTILNEKSRLKKIISNGAEGRTRTDTGLLPPDFESSVSTNSTTSAYIEQSVRLYPLIP